MTSLKNEKKISSENDDFDINRFIDNSVHNRIYADCDFICGTCEANIPS